MRADVRCVWQIWGTIFLRIASQAVLASSSNLRLLVNFAKIEFSFADFRGELRTDLQALVAPHPTNRCGTSLRHEVACCGIVLRPSLASDIRTDHEAPDDVLLTQSHVETSEMATYTGHDATGIQGPRRITRDASRSRRSGRFGPRWPLYVF